MFFVFIIMIITIIIANNKVDIEIKFVSCGEEVRVENRNVLDKINEYFKSITLQDLVDKYQLSKEGIIYYI